MAEQLKRSEEVTVVVLGALNRLVEKGLLEGTPRLTEEGKRLLAGLNYVTSTTKEVAWVLQSLVKDPEERKLCGELVAEELEVIP